MRQMRLIRHFAAARRLLVVSVMVLTPTIGLATGCSSVRKAIDNANASAAAYSDLQGFIRDQLTTKFSRSVRSVSCTPHVDQVLPGDTADLTCAVVFTDGTSYATPAKITDPSTDPDIATESFSFNDPPAIDITTAPLPSPAVTLAATSPDSLLLAGNLAPVLSKLTARFGSQDLIVQMAIYPGELEAVIAGNNGEARAVTATYTGALTVGIPGSLRRPPQRHRLLSARPRRDPAAYRADHHQGQGAPRQYQPLRAYQLPARRQFWLDHLPDLGQHPVPGTRARQRPADHHAKRHTRPELNVDPDARVIGDDHALADADQMVCPADRYAA